jgi:hypothetical protein
VVRRHSPGAQLPDEMESGLLGSQRVDGTTAPATNGHANGAGTANGGLSADLNGLLISSSAGRSSAMAGSLLDDGDRRGGSGPGANGHGSGNGSGANGVEGVSLSSFDGGARPTPQCTPPNMDRPSSTFPLAFASPNGTDGPDSPTGSTGSTAGGGTLPTAQPLTLPTPTSPPASGARRMGSAYGNGTGTGNGNGHGGGGPGTGVAGDVRFCAKCLVHKPPRTHHCSHCNRCVLRMDHHCPWVGNCVGFYNYKFFVLFLMYTVLTAIDTVRTDRRTGTCTHARPMRLSTGTLRGHKTHTTRALHTV